MRGDIRAATVAVVCSKTLMSLDGKLHGVE
jgi:hypothetical protein